METNFRIFLSLPRRSLVFTRCVIAIAETNYITLHTLAKEWINEQMIIQMTE